MEALMRRRAFVVSTYLALGVTALWVNRAEGHPPDFKAKFADLDRDGDGRVDAQEFPGTPEQFARADRDADGGVDLREARLFQLIEEARKNPAKGRDLRERFAKGDQDGDGVITLEEFPAPASLFERFDRDGDGRVVFAEALAFTVEEEVAKAFEKHDADLSGTLNREEFPEAQRDTFDVADVDGDGEVTGQEAYALIYQVFEALVSDSPVGTTTPAPRPTPQPGMVQTGGALDRLSASFATHDRDGDGSLSPAEFPASSAWRAELDRDRDGGVSRGEVQLALGRAQRLIARAKDLKARAEASGFQGDPSSALALEARGLLSAGRLDALEALLDDAELRLLERQ
ncbi:MAG: EF-hand domain-containing protein [Planctomycetes bacterium]|nr:EF-hand domain-containing protein [Planctomycetota bacterium]